MPIGRGEVAGEAACMNNLLEQLLEELVLIRQIMEQNQAATAKRDALLEQFTATLMGAIAMNAIPTVDQQRRPAGI